MTKSKKSKTPIKSSSFTDTYLLIGFLAIILLHIIGGYWHSYSSWGFSYWSTLDENTIVILGALAIISLFLVYMFRNKIQLNFLEKLQINLDSKPLEILSLTIASICLYLLFYFLRVKAFVYGDGFLILEHALSMENIFLESKNYMEILTIFSYYIIITISQKFGIYSNELTLGVFNSIGGVVGFWALLKIVGLLSQNQKEKFFFYSFH